MVIKEVHYVTIVAYDSKMNKIQHKIGLSFVFFGGGILKIHKNVGLFLMLLYFFSYIVYTFYYSFGIYPLEGLQRKKRALFFLMKSVFSF